MWIRLSASRVRIASVNRLITTEAVRLMVCGVNHAYPPRLMRAPSSTQTQPTGITTALNCATKCTYKVKSINVCIGTINDTISNPLGLISVSKKKFSVEIRASASVWSVSSGWRHSR